MDVFTRIAQLHFPKGEYIVVGSALMEIKGIRETQDLDVVVSSQLFAKCKSEGWEILPWTKMHLPGKEWLRKDLVEVYDQLTTTQGGVTLDTLLVDAEVIHGIPFLNLARLAEYKKEYGRKKDFDDIDAIEKYLATGKAGE
jgi:hypothetical protein